MKLVLQILLFMTITFHAGTALDLTCFANLAEFSLSEEDISALGVTVEDLIVLSPERLFSSDDLPPECIATTADPGFTINITQCKPEITSDDECIYFTWVVRNQPFKNPEYPITRFNDSCFNATCKFNKSELISTGLLIPEIQKFFVADPEEDEGEFDISLYFCTDDTCDEELPADSIVQVANYIYAKANLNEVDEENPDFILEMVNCWATLSDDADSEPQYNIVQDSCKAINPFDPVDAIDITRNYYPIYGQFDFRSFFWTGIMAPSQAIYLHCDVCVCYKEDGEDCPKPDCSDAGRRRRDIPDKLETQRITHGPLYINPSEESCDNNNGGCSDACLMDGWKAVCACYVGRTLLDDGKTCAYAEEHVAVENDSQILLIAGACIMALFSVALVFFALVRRSGEKNRIDL